MIALALTATLLASQPIRLETGPPPAARIFERKAVAGEAAFGREVEAAVGRLRHRSETRGRCETPAETAAAAQFELARRTPDLAAFERERAVAEAALAQRRDLRTRYLGGAPTAPPYGLVGRMVARAKAEADPRLAALYRRMAEDQFSRLDSATLEPFLGPGVHTAWETGLSDAALAYTDATIIGEWCAIDVANAAWLKADLKANGWYRVSVYGADADEAAWSIAQHARHDLAFQETVLAMMEPLWRVGETKGRNYAALYDQTARRRGRPARFGVGGACTAPGVWTPDALEDRKATEAWRAKAGMPPLAELVATRSKACGPQ
jgi:hypothetical protein